MHKVFVYGSLLSNMGNHGLLVGSKKLGISRSPKNLAMLDLGYFPGVVVDDKHEGTIVGEVYEVDDNTLASLDRLEGYYPDKPTEGLYNKMEIDTDYGKATIYIYNNKYGRSLGYVDNGDWKTYLSERRRHG